MYSEKFRPELGRVFVFENNEARIRGSVKYVYNLVLITNQSAHLY